MNKQPVLNKNKDKKKNQVPTRVLLSLVSVLGGAATACALPERAPHTAEAGFEAFDQTIQGTVDFIISESLNESTPHRLISEETRDGVLTRLYEVSRPDGSPGYQVRIEKLDNKMIGLELIDSENLVLPGVGSYMSYGVHEQIENEPAWSAFVIIGDGTGSAQHHPVNPNLQSAEENGEKARAILFAGLLDR